MIWVRLRGIGRYIHTVMDCFRVLHYRSRFMKVGFVGVGKLGKDAAEVMK